MSKFLACLIATCLTIQVFGHGKAPKVPTLSAATIKALQPTSKAKTESTTEQNVATCFEGYTLQTDGTCVKPIEEEPIPTSGSVILPYIPDCLEGYTFDGIACTKNEPSDPLYFCPVGWEDGGNSCIQNVPGETVTSCTDGQLIGNSCVDIQHAPHIITPKCPEGTTIEHDGNCWKTMDTFDCTPHTGKEAPAGRVVGPTPTVPFVGRKVVVSKGQHLRKLHGKTAGLRPVVEEPVTKITYSVPNSNSVHGRVVVVGDTPSPTPSVAPIGVYRSSATESCEKEMVAVSAPHPTKIGVASQLCAKKIQVDALAIVSCPEGFTDAGDDCTRERSTSPNVICLTNGATHGPCPPLTKTAPKYPKCLSGSPIGPDGKCPNTETLPVGKSCGVGFQDVGTGCQALVTTGLDSVECRDGLTLVDTPNGKKCVGQSVRPSVALKVAKAGCTNKY